MWSVTVAPRVSDSDAHSERSTTDPSDTAAFVAALNVPRNAKIGLVLGVTFAALVYAVRVFELLGPAPQGRGGPVLFLALAFVLAFGTFVLVTTLLTLVSAYRRVQELDDGPRGRE